MIFYRWNILKFKISPIYRPFHLVENLEFSLLWFSRFSRDTAMPVNSVWIGRIGNWICHRVVPWRDCRVDDVTLLRHFESRLFWTLLRGFVPFKRGLVMCLWVHAIGNWMSYDILSLKHFKIQDFTNLPPLSFSWEPRIFSTILFTVFSRYRHATDLCVDE